MAQLDGIDLSVADASFMPPAGYRSRRFFDMEMSEVFPRTWVFVGDVNQIPDPGDYITDVVGWEPVVVLRDEDGAVRAFSNVCTHRASLIVDGQGSCGKLLTCPYHGWSFKLDGKLAGTPYGKDFVAPLQRERLGLRELRVDVWEQFIFVNVSGTAPPLDEYLEDLPAKLSGHGLQDVRRIHEVDDVVEANWKVFIDNAFCDYHVPFVHRRLMPMISRVADFQESAGDWTCLLHTPLSEFGKTLAPVRPTLVRGARENTLAFGVFPNLLGIAFVTGDIHLLHWSPLAIDRTRSRVHAYSHTEPDQDDFRYGRDAIVKLQGEDYFVVEAVQKGVQSDLYHAGPRHYLETRLFSFQRALMRVLTEVVESGDAGGESAAR
jgi:phenylpropionate dioxygenase-like ring-hydroxylating dioxygenase large terminal subunit